jgi:Uma2 family endonuclease
MAATLVSQPITIKEYLKFKAPPGFRDELVYGRIIVSPEPKVLHFQIADNLYELLKRAVGKKYRVAQRINLRFPVSNSMPSPDVFVIERAAYDSALQSNSYPDGTRVVLAVEVLSPSNRKKAVLLKTDLYRANRIEVWVVDPKAREVKIFRDEQVSSIDDGTLSLPIALGGKALPLSRIFDLTA